MVLEPSLRILRETEDSDTIENLDSQKSMSEIMDVIKRVITKDFLYYTRLIGSFLDEISGCMENIGGCISMNKSSCIRIDTHEEGSGRMGINRPIIFLCYLCKYLCRRGCLFISVTVNCQRENLVMIYSDDLKIIKTIGGKGSTRQEGCIENDHQISVDGDGGHSFS